MLWDIRERLETMLFRLQIQGISLKSDPEKWIAHHEDILDAILENKPKQAEKLVMKSSMAIREVIVSLADEVFT